MLLALLALILALGVPGLPVPRSALPPTQPGLGHDEGVFLLTQASDGTQAIYFIARNVRHSILPADVQAEEQLNPLWPVRAASQQDVLAYPEGAPIGNARSGLVQAPQPAQPADAVQPAEAVQPDGVAGQTLVIPPSSADAAAPGADDSASEAEATPASGTAYTVRRGDSAFTIARQFGVSIDDLLAANGITNPNHVEAGQVLTIPAGSS